MKAIGKLPVATQLIVWMALGPFFLVATLSALLLQFSAGSLAVSSIAIAGLFLSSLFRMRGFVASAIIVIGYLCFNPPLSLWAELCLVLPILAALFLTALCMEEVRGVLNRRECQLRNLEAFKAGHQQHQQQYTQEKEQLLAETKRLTQSRQEDEQWISSVKQLMAIGQLETAQTKRMRAKYIDRIQADQRVIEDLKRKLKTQPVQEVKSSDGQLLQRLNEMRVRHYQLELLTEQYRDQIKRVRPQLASIAKLKADNLQLQHQLKTKVAVIEKPTGHKNLYEQLRVQFHEKDAQLHKARQDVYRNESDALIAQKAIGESDHYLSYDQELLCEYLNGLEFEVAHLEHENRTLIELLSQELSESQGPDQ
ncbi:MAG: hypothetical protein KDK50_00280 [Chlamydiia bacterium]|nr:hypothetical protein [Chlamydiia bacterium]